MYAKEQDGRRMQNPIMEIPFPWWKSEGSQCRNEQDHDDQLKSLCMINHEAGQTKRSGSDFTISCGGEQKNPQPWTVVSEQSGCQQMICAKYPYVDHCYGLFSAFGPQLAARIMLPISMTTDEGPIYVNAKQYHGIMRRRKSRAKAELENRVMKARKPYLHESRHRHAMRRERGSGGRFLGTKKSESSKSGESTQNSMNSDSKDRNGGSSSCLTLSGISEVTSTLYPRAKGDFNIFQINGSHPSICSLADAMGGGDCMVMPHKWFPAAGNCCNLKV